MRIRAIAALAAAASLALAAPAMADSIAYVKDGNVWLSTTDGSRQFQVTSTGGYSDVTQADDGTMVALTGVRLHKLDRQGNVLADFDTPVSDTRQNGFKAFYGPFDPALSPDGSKLAYTYYYRGVSQDPNCFPPACVTVGWEGGTGYSHSDRQTDWAEAGFGKHSGWLHPSWIDNANTMLSHATHWPNQEVVLDTVGDGPQLLHDWFTDRTNSNDGGQMAHGEMTRQRTKMAFVTGAGDTQLRFYKIRQFPQGGPHGDWGSSLTDAELPYICGIYGNPAGGKFGPPSWSPDGTRVAYHDGEGVKLVTVPDWPGDECSSDGLSPTGQLLVAGGIEPDWGPADVPPARVIPDPPPPPSAKITLKVGKAKLRQALSRGLKVKVSVPAAGKLTGSAVRGRKAMAAGTGRAKGAGTTTLTLRFNKKAKRTLAHSRRAKLTVKVAFTAGGAKKAQNVTTTIGLR
jgi:WD40 repeat protein